jgi:hypothetical protein
VATQRALWANPSLQKLTIWVACESKFVTQFVVTLMTAKDQALFAFTSCAKKLLPHEGGEHHVTIPLHDPLRIGTFAAILDDVATHFGISRAELLTKIFP